MTPHPESDRHRLEDLSKVIHDLKSPVAALQGYAQLLRIGAAGPVTEKQSSYLDSMSASCWILYYLLENLRVRETMRSEPEMLWEEGGNVRALIERVIARLQRAFEPKSARVIASAPSHPLSRGARLVEIAASALLLTAIHTSVENADIVIEAQARPDDLVLRLRAPGVVGPGPLDVIPAWSEYLTAVGGEARIAPGHIELVIPGAILG